MLKVYLQTLAGLALTFAGLYIIFGYIVNIVDGGSIWLLLVGFPLIGGGGFLLYRAGKSEATVVKKNLYQPMPLGSDFLEEDTKGLGKTIDKNIKMEKEYAKSSESRTRLKILGAAAENEK